jgi:tetratricopeptide (TPR) repeat protein/tRNA A-37 threonylcarbamoyl transferase component Bud32
MIGQRLLHYQILEKLGAGGMGVVYKARDTHLDRFVAIKILPPEKVSDPQRKARFVQEAKAASALNHPNIVHIYDIGTDAGVEFIAMEYVAGKALDQLIPRKGMRLNEALRIAAQVADAMARAHQAGIVHRDLKPSNLMVDEHGAVKIVDFGLAKLTETAETDGDAATRTVLARTEEGTIVGTAAYMSPEQAEGRELDGRSDIFSFGAVLYEMVTGRRAFSGDTAIATLATVIKEHPTPVSELAPETPRDFEKLITRCLQKQPDRRWQSMADLHVALGELREESDSGAGRAVSSPAKGGSRWRWVALALLPLVIAGAWLLWRYGTREAPPKRILTTRDVLVLADFANSTGDPVFDGTLREALSSRIENSSMLRVMSPGQVRVILADMKRPPDAPISAALASEICIRAREKATLAGSIAALGSMYAITLTATNCQTGETLATQLVEAQGKEQVLGALARAVDGIRETLGESLPNIQRTLAEASVSVGGTTASLEAYQAFAMGLTQVSLGRYAAAIPHFDRAIQLDPDLAIAYTQEAIAHMAIGQGSRARELFRKGFEHRMHASERERLWIEGRYYQAEGDLDKARPVFEELVRLYPNSLLGINSIGNIYRQFGEFEKALPMYREVVRLTPESSLGYEQLLSTLTMLDRFEEAHAVAEMPAVKRLNSPDTRLALLRLHYLEGDLVAAEGAIHDLEGTRYAVESLRVQRAYAFAVGKFRSVEALQAKADEAARRQNLGRSALDLKLQNASYKAHAGLCSDVEATVTPELLKPDVAWAPDAAAALAICGDVAKAQRLADGMVKMGMSGQVWDSLRLPFIRARIFLAQRKPAEAIAALETARAFERGSPGVALARGEAFSMSNKPGEAAVEFRKVVDVKANLLGSSYNAAQVGLARALAASGDIAGARKAYETFFDLWKSADPGIPLLVAARKEYAALH